MVEVGEHNILKWRIRQPVKRPDSLITPLERSWADTLDYKEMLQIVYRADASGRYEEIVNWPQVERFRDSLWRKMTLGYMTDSSKHEIVKKLKETFMTRPSIEAKLTRDIAALHVVYNKKHERSESNAQDQVPGINDLTLTQMAKSRIVENNAENAIVKITQEFDPVEFKEQVGLVVGDLTNDTLPNYAARISDDIIVDYSKITGWPIKVEYWRSISMGIRRKTIGIVLKQIER
jgi:hypothetical protein